MQESSSSPECSGNPFSCAARKRLERKAGCSVKGKRKPSAPKNKKRLEISNLCSILQLFFLHSDNRHRKHQQVFVFLESVNRFHNSRAVWLGHFHGDVVGANDGKHFRKEF